jgi:hypothetical protein
MCAAKSLLVIGSTSQEISSAWIRFRMVEIAASGDKKRHGKHDKQGGRTGYAKKVVGKKP